jgi:hypothetical protein
MMDKSKVRSNAIPNPLTSVNLPERHAECCSVTGSFGGDRIRVWYIDVGIPPRGGSDVAAVTTTAAKENRGDAFSGDPSPLRSTGSAAFLFEPEQLRTSVSSG